MRVRGVTPFAADDRVFFLPPCRRIAVNEFAQLLKIPGGAFRRLARRAVGMHADAIEKFQRAGFEKVFKKWPRHFGCSRRKDSRLWVRLADGLACRQRQRGVLARVGFRPPEKNVRLVPNFPDHVAAMEVSGGGGGPARESFDGRRMLR